MKFLLTNSEGQFQTSKETPFELTKKKVGDYTWYCEKENSVFETDRFLSLTEGYMRDLDQDIAPGVNSTEKVVQQYSRKWPLPENVTGSFSSVVVDKELNEIILFNDVIGIYPLYYKYSGEELFISNSIILLGIFTGGEFDEVGITQRCMAPEFSAIGGRTILKDCRRLLPGEWIKFEQNKANPEVKYDNSLYHNLSSPDLKKEQVRDYWRSYKREVKFLLNNSKSVKLALSGGIDSRTLLAAIPEDKELNCLTYGAEDNYETEIANRLARLKKASFKSFSQPELYFPDVEKIMEYTLDTEALYLNSWLEILENTSEEKSIPLLIGDFSTVLTGRTIKKFSGKKLKPRDFINHFVFQKPYQLEENNPESFQEWKNEVFYQFSRRYTPGKVSQLNSNLGREQLISSLKTDLEELFCRIESHNLKYIELVDELFTWYTHSRIPMGKQVLICNRKYKAFCPSMSLGNLRMASRMHPNSRLSFRFIKKLFREAKEFEELKKVPTSQAPLVPFNFPDFIRFPIWAAREKVDQVLIKRMVRKNDPYGRYRLFKSNNWVQVYQNPEMEDNIRAYFSKNQLGEGYSSFLLNQAKARKNMKQWPFANLEIINAAGLNAELNYIRKYTE
ncbi:hypothetical protein [Salinimicrobium soli]|uniref:hypothetical protein n=1 Tax=Salinimicrobium soli TaxID=1254399 RepID=UPI003AAF5D62